MTQRSAMARFLEKIDRSPEHAGCWLWTGATNANGYARFKVDGRDVLAHVWVYEQTFGPMPEGHETDHTCRVRRCVRPSHLEAVTHLENMRRVPASDRCPRGHEHAPATTTRLLADGARSPRRRCATCHRDAERDRKARLRSAA